MEGDGEDDGDADNGGPTTLANRPGTTESDWAAAVTRRAQATYHPKRARGDHWVHDFRRLRACGGRGSFWRVLRASRCAGLYSVLDGADGSRRRAFIPFVIAGKEMQESRQAAGEPFGRVRSRLDGTGARDRHRRSEYVRMCSRLSRAAIQSLYHARGGEECQPAASPAAWGVGHSATGFVIGDLGWSSVQRGVPAAWRGGFFEEGTGRLSCSGEVGVRRREAVGEDWRTV
ncbi:hypothetical protein C8Q77DRAFT_572801 [Trametes polyzona]|nr:hypothetical protein C8Q77DRAFT_572801 [Trametes polyzona]